MKLLHPQRPKEKKSRILWKDLALLQTQAKTLTIIAKNEKISEIFTEDDGKEDDDDETFDEECIDER